MSHDVAVRRPLLVLVAVTALLALPVPAGAHSYADPSLLTVLDEVRPALPAGASVALAPSVVDTLVVTNAGPAPLDVLGPDGRPYLRVSAAGVLANVAHPWWFTTAVPEGGPAVPASARLGAAPRWARVSREPTWSVFDPRVRPPVEVTRELREQGRELVLTTWTLPLRYDGKPAEATGHVLLSPVRGGLVVAVTERPAGLEATALQGGLPGLLLRVPAGGEVVVLGRDGAPFLRFAGGRVLARRESPSWRADQQARGRAVSGSGWAEVARGQVHSWLEPRLRYPRDVPPDDVVGRTSVVRRWEVPLRVDGSVAWLRGTVTWVPRAEGVRAVQPGRAREERDLPLWTAGLVAVSVAGAGVALVRRRGRRADSSG
jgi:hypothetical protein